MKQKYYSFTPGIPAKESNSKLYIANQNEELFVYICEERDILQEIKALQFELAERKKKKIKNMKIKRIVGVYLTKTDSKNLIEEINYRLS